MKVGIFAEDGGFPQVLSRLNQNSTRVENNLGIAVDVPSVSNADTSEGSPARGRTIGGSFKNLISLQEVSELQAHMNREDNVFSHYHDELTSKYDDLAFILPFSDGADIAEIKAVESHVCNRMGPRLHSGLFRHEVLRSRTLHQPNSNAAEITYTEFILCGTVFLTLSEIVLLLTISTAWALCWTF